jgi:drug/metabolite transporter (DMT)-like permease
MEIIGEISALATAILWSFSSILFTTLTKEIGTIQLNLWRLVFAAILLILTISIFGIGFELTGYQLLLLGISGIIGLVLGDTFLFAAFRVMGPRLSLLVMSINPAIAAILAYFILDESLGIYGIAGMMITLLGIYFVLMQKKEADGTGFKISLKGIIFGLIGSIGQATGLIFAKLVLNDGQVNGLIATEIRIISAIFFLLPSMILTGRFVSPVKLFGNNIKLIGNVTMGSIIGPYLGITLSYIAIINTKIGIAATLMSMTPLILIPLSAIFYKEKINIASIFGTIIAFAGVAILFLS